MKVAGVPILEGLPWDLGVQHGPIGQIWGTERRNHKDLILFCKLLTIYWGIYTEINRSFQYNVMNTVTRDKEDFYNT